MVIDSRIIAHIFRGEVGYMDMEVTWATLCIKSCVLYFDCLPEKFSHPISFEVTAATLGSANNEPRSEEGSGLSVALLCKYYFYTVGSIR